jgi:hypothetical protein
VNRLRNPSLKGRITVAIGTGLASLLPFTHLSAEEVSKPNYGIEIFEGVRKVTPKPAPKAAALKPRALLFDGDAVNPLDIKPVVAAPTTPPINVFVTVPPQKTESAPKSAPTSIAPANFQENEPRSIAPAIAQPQIVVVPSELSGSKDTFPTWLASLLGTMGALVGFYVLLVLANLLVWRKGGSPFMMMPGNWNSGMMPYPGMQAPVESKPTIAEPETQTDLNPFGELGIPKGPGVIFVEPWEVPEPNFDIGMTYEEERIEEERRVERQAAAVLTHIFQQNRNLLAQLETTAKPPVVEMPSQPVLEVETHEVSAEAGTHDTFLLTAVTTEVNLEPSGMNDSSAEIQS